MLLKRQIETSLARQPHVYLDVLRWLGRGSPEKRAYLSLLRSGDVVFDIGANCGTFSLLFSDIVGPRGAVHAFEPVPPTFNALTSLIRERQRYRNVTLTRAACGDGTGATQIFMPGTDAGQASLRRQCDGSWRDAPAVAEFTTELIQLDRYVATRSVERVDFVKCDVEGGELPAFKGMAATLRRDRPLLMVEAYGPWSGAFGYTTGDLIQFLSSVGYDSFEPLTDQSNMLCGVSALHGDRLQRAARR